MVKKKTPTKAKKPSCKTTGCGKNSGGAGSKTPYRNPKLPVEKRVKDLLSRMTLQEKADQLRQICLGDTNPNNIGVNKFQATVGSILGYWRGVEHRNEFQRQAVEETRLGIPIIWGFDVIHGHDTTFPIPLAQACSFNPEIARIGCEVAAVEAVHWGINWTFAPMVDICRDPRWGRIAEGYGEDPLVASEFGKASVEGFQGEKDKFDTAKNLASCLKHFCGYGFSEAGKDYCYSDISRLTLWETILPSFEAGVKSGAMTLMSSFNDITGTPAVCNSYTMSDILRGKWKFDGFVVSDWCGVDQLKLQGYSEDPKKQTIAALTAGNDMDMVDDCFKTIPELVEKGELSLKIVDEAVSRVLRIKFRMGLFEKPYSPVVPREGFALKAEYLEAAQKAAEETLVLLKNQKNTLPLPKKLKSMALIGPAVTDKTCMKGMWGSVADINDMVTIEDGLRQSLPKDCKLVYEKGCDFSGDDQSGFKKAIAAAKKCDSVVMCMGEEGDATGEDRSRANIRMHGQQVELIKQVAALGKPVILVICSGRPMDIYEVEPLVSSILYAWQPGIRGGAAIADTILGKANPSGKLAVTFPKTQGHIPTFYNQRPFSRNQGWYKDMGCEPLYPFGHGLSYSKFTYSDLKLSRKSLKTDGSITVSVKIKNTGRKAGKEAVLWFLRDPEATITQPVKKLVCFEKIGLAAGEEKVVKLKIDPMQHLSYVNEEGKRILEAGRFTIQTGELEPIEFVLQ